MKALLLASLLLAGCSTTPERFEVPVSVPCKAPIPAKPVFATEILAKDANVFERAKAVLAEIKQRRAYETELEAAILACQ